MSSIEQANTVQAMAALVSTIRKQHSQFPGLAFEVFLHCATGPKTIEDLSELTGATSGSLTHAVRNISAWWSSAESQIIRPNLHLLIRRKVVNGRGYRYSLSVTGRKLLEGV